MSGAPLRPPTCPSVCPIFSRSAGGRGAQRLPAHFSVTGRAGPGLAPSWGMWGWLEGGRQGPLRRRASLLAPTNIRPHVPSRSLSPTHLAPPFLAPPFLAPPLPPPWLAAAPSAACAPTAACQAAAAAPWACRWRTPAETKRPWAGAAPRPSGTCRGWKTRRAEGVVTRLRQPCQRWADLPPHNPQPCAAASPDAFLPALCPAP